MGLGDLEIPQKQKVFTHLPVRNSGRISLTSVGEPLMYVQSICLKIKGALLLMFSNSPDRFCGLFVLTM